MTEKNMFDKSLGESKPRRRTAGESAGGAGRAAPAGPAAREGEKRIAVDVPVGLYTEAKVLAAQQDTTVKEILVAGLSKEVAARRAGA